MGFKGSYPQGVSQHKTKKSWRKGSLDKHHHQSCSGNLYRQSAYQAARLANDWNRRTWKEAEYLHLGIPLKTALKSAILLYACRVDRPWTVAVKWEYRGERVIPSMRLSWRTGQQWMKQIVSFDKLKLTNNLMDDNGHVSFKMAIFYFFQ